MSSYAGSPALAPEAREKVLQTFRHTLVLAQEGKNEEALLGCDFLLKMDARFAPARSLLEALRGVAPGTPVNVERFADYLGVESAGEALPDSAHDLPDAFPGGPATPVPPGPASGLDDLVFGDESGGASASGLPEAPPSVIAPRAVAPVVQGGDPFGLGLDDLRMSMPPGGPGAVSTIPAPASAPPLASPPSGPPLAQPAPAQAAPRPASGVQADPRITQFLKQGDEALARGNAQEAIDLWSRVFLIDLSNEEASRRIDSAREAQGPGRPARPPRRRGRRSRGDRRRHVPVPHEEAGRPTGDRCRHPRQGRRARRQRGAPRGHVPEGRCALQRRQNRRGDRRPREAARVGPPPQRSARED